MRLPIATLLCCILATLPVAAKKPKPLAYHECLGQICIDDLKFVNSYSGLALYTTKLVGSFRNNTDIPLRDVVLTFVTYFKGSVSGDSMCIVAVIPPHSSWSFEALPSPSGMRVDTAASPVSIELTSPDGKRGREQLTMKKACNHGFRAKFCE